MPALPHGIQKSVPLGPLTTLRVGGPAQFFLEATTDSAIEEALCWADSEGIAVTVLGEGSNVVVADDGVDGLVLRIATRGVSWNETRPRVEVTASAGENWDVLAEESVRRELAGFECLAGIPGLVGATPIQNVGAYGQEVGDTVQNVHAWDRCERRHVDFDRAACDFGYRTSIFKRDPHRFVVLSVRFALAEGAPKVAYAELKQAIGSAKPTLTKVRDTVLGLRAKKSMLLDPTDPNHRSAGSFFTNPIVSNDEADRITERALTDGLIVTPKDMPRFPASAGESKLAAAWLIERAGFPKGTTRGAVGLSSNHSLAIVNHGNALAVDILAFARAIRNAVRDHFGVTLYPEPQLVGVRWDEATL